MLGKNTTNENFDNKIEDYRGAQNFSQVKPLLCVMLYKYLVAIQEHCIKYHPKSSFKASAQQSS